MTPPAGVMFYVSYFSSVSGSARCTASLHGGHTLSPIGQEGGWGAGRREDACLSAQPGDTARPLTPSEQCRWTEDRDMVPAPCAGSQQWLHRCS